MRNQKQSISASEINKFCYCNYQWYYERLYGNKFLYKAYKERNLKLGQEDTIFSVFNKGLKFHESYKPKNTFRKIIFVTVVLLILVGIMYYYGLLKF